MVRAASSFYTTLSTHIKISDANEILFNRLQDFYFGEFSSNFQTLSRNYLNEVRGSLKH